MESIVTQYQVLRQLDEHLKLNIKSIFIFTANELLISTKDDKIYAFGDNEFGRLGLKPDKSLENPILIKGLCDKRIVDYTYGDNYVFARTDDRKTYCWGFNRFGQLANGEIDPDFNEPKIHDTLSDKIFIDICCGSCHSLALTENSEVYAWGWNGWGQIGIMNNINQSKLMKVIGLESENVIAIACGSEHSMALSKCGQVFVWGRNSCGQLGFEYNEGIFNTIMRKRVEELNIAKIVKVRGHQNKSVIFKKISCGQYHSLLLSSDGDVYAFGSNSCGQVGNNSVEDQYIPVKLNIQIKFIDITSHSKLDISVALSEDCVYYVWGKCGTDIIRIPTKTQFKSLNEIFCHYFQITFKPIEVNNEYNEKTFIFDSIQNGKYSNEYNEFKLIGAGNFGLVFKSRNISEDKICAIKKIAFNEDLTQIVFRELKIVSELSSDYVIGFKTAWIEDNNIKNSRTNFQIDGSSNSSHSVFSPENRLLLHIQMELCLSTLREIDRQINKELNQKQTELLTPTGYYIASELSIEILECVDYLHKQNPPIIHRDLKPNNILVTHGSNGRFCKIADFGLATLHEFDEQSHSTGKGTFTYMAPEVLTKKYDTKADVYSLGVIMRELFNLQKNMNFENKSNLDEKYSNLIKLVDKMTDQHKELRPKSQEILDNQFWVLSLNHVKNELQFQSILRQLNRDVKIEDSFLLYFIQQKSGSSEPMQF